MKHVDFDIETRRKTKDINLKMTLQIVCQLIEHFEEGRVRQIYANSCDVTLNNNRF